MQVTFKYQHISSDTKTEGKGQVVHETQILHQVLSVPYKVIRIFRG